MGAFLQLAVNEFLLPLLWWSAVFALAAACISVGVIWWLVRRLRAISARGGRVSGARMLIAGLTVCVGSVVVPVSIAFVHAVPFSVERGLTAAIERSAPLASDWLVDLSASQMAGLLHVDLDDTAIDVSRLSARVSTALATLRAIGRPEPLLDRLRWLSAKESLGLMEKSVAELRGHVSWHDLVRTTKSRMRTRLSWLSEDAKLSLEVAARANVYSAATQVAACNAVVVLIVLLIIRRPVISFALGPEAESAALNSDGQAQSRRGSTGPNRSAG